MNPYAMKIGRLYLLFIYLLILHACRPEPRVAPWHGVERSVRYHPDGEDFVIVNGKRRFNRALYGSNSAFRAEAGDLPEFALYLPGMGGNLKLGIGKSDGPAQPAACPPPRQQ